MQRLGRAAVAVMQAHRTFAADITARLQAAGNCCLSSGASRCWLEQQGRSLQDQLVAACTLQQVLRGSNGSSSSSSSRTSSNAWWASSGSISSIAWQWHPAATQLHHRQAFSTRQPSPLSVAPSASTESDVEMKGSSTDAGAGVLSSTPPAVPAAQQQQHKPALILGTCKRKNIKVSWKKLDFVLRMVRKSYVDDAMAQLHANPKKAAMYAQHALANARSNAIYAGADPAKLWVAEAFVTKAKYDKQRNIMGRGYSSMKLTRYSHLNITVKQLEVGDVATAKRLHRRPKMTAPFMFREQQRWQQQPALAGGSSRSFTTS